MLSTWTDGSDGPLAEPLWRGERTRPHLDAKYISARRRELDTAGCGIFCKSRARTRAGPRKFLLYRQPTLYSGAGGRRTETGTRRARRVARYPYRNGAARIRFHVQMFGHNTKTNCNRFRLIRKNTPSPGPILDPAAARLGVWERTRERTKSSRRAEREPSDSAAAASAGSGAPSCGPWRAVPRARLGRAAESTGHVSETTVPTAVRR